ncbi:MAG: adenylate/guanylate cyclase domain-containing protein [Gammaproteobacteria bacterium]|nr:adenylate/guanylate cyclase domain-containing protein [Gammaproteobacteria bacterium]
MSSIKVAHLRIQGIDFVFVPLDARMSQIRPPDQNQLALELRKLCQSAGLLGDVVPVWQGGAGTSFMASPAHQPILAKSLRLDFVRNNINKNIAAIGISPLLAQLTLDTPQAAVTAITTAAHSAVPPASNTAQRPHDDPRRSLPSVRDSSRTTVTNRVVTMLFSDVVGSTKLKQEYGDAQSMEVLNKHHALVRSLLKSTTTGEEVSTQGDSFFIAFAVPSEAVVFALRWQSAVRDFAEEEGVRLQDRIGIHVGEVYADNAKVAGKEFDFNGIQVDTASRIMSLGQGNQILLSHFAYHNARQMLEGFEFDGLDDLAWRAHGLYDVKGVDHPIEIFEVGEARRGHLKAPPDSEKAKRHSK